MRDHTIYVLHQMRIISGIVMIIVKILFFVPGALGGAGLRSGPGGRGCALVSGLFIPVLGIPQTCYGAALMALAGFALLL